MYDVVFGSVALGCVILWLLCCVPEGAVSVCFGSGSVKVMLYWVLVL